MADVIDIKTRKPKGEDPQQSLASELSTALSQAANKYLQRGVSPEMIVLVLYRLMYEGIRMSENKAHMFNHIADKMNEDFNDL